MEPWLTALLAALFFAGAVLYSSVGHAGASAYLAVMALLGLAPEVMRPTALVLNIAVAGLGTVRYARAGLLDWRALWPLALGAAPFAFLGGSLALPGETYRTVLGVLLGLAALRLLLPGEIAVPATSRPVRRLIAVPAGAGIGLLAGLTGTGGGIFLSPLVIFSGWAGVRAASGIASGFILANSIAGLAGAAAGALTGTGALPAELPLFLLAVLCGAAIGTTLGISGFTQRHLLRALAVVLLIAAGKLILD